VLDTFFERGFEVGDFVVGCRELAKQIEECFVALEKF
jgi:hypothetical protein